MMLGLSKNIQRHIRYNTLSTRKAPDQKTGPNKVGCQPGDCRWPLESSSEACVGMYAQ